MRAAGPVVVTVAGADSSGGAGIAADQRAIEANGGRAACAITAITAQGPRRVLAVHAVSAAVLRDQLVVLRDDLPIAAVKVGMLGTGALVRDLTDWLATLDRAIPVVIDPVLRSTSGAQLLDDDGVAALPALFARATVLTPNAAEARSLAGSLSVARWAQALGCAVLITGGDEPDPDVVTDWLHEPGFAPLPLRAPRRPGPSPRGTGCTLAATLATLLARGVPVRDACKLAGDYVRDALMA